jgi:hypothetical protein
MRTHISLSKWTARLLAAMALPATYACGSDSDTEPPVSEFACESPTPLVEGQQTGFELCASGFVHRPTTATCSSTLPRDGAQCLGEGAQCVGDTDCTEQPNGFCAAWTTGEGGDGCSCNYGCLTDTDCEGSQICVCGDPVGRCVNADCTTDDDCEGGLCATTIVGDPGCGSTRFICQTGADQCGGNADCSDGEFCVVPEDGQPRSCQPMECFAGRPFLIGGVTRTAGNAARGDWRALIAAPSLESLDEQTRGELGSYWAHVGAMEHASIAAFARFTLQLLSLGAPATLLEDTQAAMADETEHARLCYGLASAYLGQAVGPAPLDVGGALQAMDAASILADAIREGCIGETVASMEAAEAAACAEDPALRAVLLRIAEDEARHAELAWRFVRWAVSRDASLRAAAVRVFAEATAEARGAMPPEAEDLAWLACGRVTPAVHRRLHEQAMLRVVAPCARALLAAPPVEAASAA